MVDISDLLDSKPEWKQCPKCNKWLPSQNALYRHYELLHLSYTPFDKEFNNLRRFNPED